MWPAWVLFLATYLVAISSFCKQNRNLSFFLSLERVLIQVPLPVQRRSPLSATEAHRRRWRSKCGGSLSWSYTWPDTCKATIPRKSRSFRSASRSGWITVKWSLVEVTPCKCTTRYFSYQILSRNRLFWWSLFPVGYTGGWHRVRFEHSTWRAFEVYPGGRSGHQGMGSRSPWVSTQYLWCRLGKI